MIYDDLLDRNKYESESQTWDEATQQWVDPVTRERVEYAKGTNPLWMAATTIPVVGPALKAAHDSTQVAPPPPVAKTAAGKQASTFATDLVNAQKSLPTPTYGTAPSIPVGARPLPPSADIYATANRELATIPTGYGDLASGINNLSAGLVQRGSVATSPYSVGGTAVNQQNAQIQDAQRQIAEYQKATAAWDQIYGGQAQQSGYQASAMQIGSNSNGFQPGMQAPTATAPQLTGSAPRVTFNPLTGRYDVQAPQQIRAGTVAAQLIGDQQMKAPADISQAGPMRDAQLRALALYEGAANGTAPSAAEALLRKGIDENVGAQYGMAASLQGNTPGLALRAGLTGAQGAVAKSAADMAALRAEEQERGRAGFLSAATGIRQQDIQIAQSNQTKDLTTAVTNLNARIDILKANQAAALQAGMANQAADLQAQIHNATNQLEAAKASAANSLTRDVANLTASLDASKANAASQVAQNIANLNAQTQITQANLNSALQTGIAAEANRLQAMLADQQRQLEAARANQQALLDEARINAQTAADNARLAQNQQQFNSGMAMTAQQQNAANALQQQQINNQLYQGITGNALSGVGMNLGMASTDTARKFAADSANAGANSALIGGVLSTGGTLLNTAIRPTPMVNTPSFASQYTAPSDPDDIFRYRG